MENINQKLDNLERLMLAQKTVLTFEEFCIYCGISKAFGYKLTSKKLVPFYKPTGKIIYFKKEEVDNWLLQNKHKANFEIEAESNDYVLKNNKSKI